MMLAATPELAEVLPSPFNPIGFEAILPAPAVLWGVPKHLVMPLEALDVVGRLKKESKQIQKRGRVPGLRVERVEVGALDFDGIAPGSAPLPVKIQALPAVADGGPDLAPSGLRPQNVNHHAPAVAAGLVAIQLDEAIFAFGKILAVCDRNGPGFPGSQLRESLNGTIGIDPPPCGNAGAAQSVVNRNCTGSSRRVGGRSPTAAGGVKGTRVRISHEFSL